MDTLEPTPTNESWNLGALRLHAKTLGDGGDSLIEIVDSISDYIDIFLYHFASARDAMAGLIVCDDTAGIKNLNFVFGTADNQAEFNRARIRSHAHIVAVATTTRALYDLFSHLVNGFVLGNALSDRDCDITRAAAKVPSSGLKQALDELLSSRWFKYVSAFANVVKHRKLVRQEFHVSFDGSPHGMRIQAFEYNGTTYRQYAANDFLVGMLEVKNKIVACGRALNDLVAGRVGDSATA